MTNQNSQVVVAYDFSHSGREALYRSIALAARAPFHILHFIYVIDHHVTFAFTEQKQQELTDAIAQELRARKVTDRVHFYVHVRIGKPAEEILALAREIGADLIILGSKGLTGVERFVLGSVSERVVREAGCTVEVARPKAYAYVHLEDVREVERHQHYTAPHRYSYDNTCAPLRPDEWPLY